MAIRDEEGAAASASRPRGLKVIAFGAERDPTCHRGRPGRLEDPPSASDPTIDLKTVVFVLFGGIGSCGGR